MVRYTKVSKNIVMNRYITILTSVIFFALTQGLSADSLSLEACKRIALDTNPMSRAACEGVVVAYESVGMARSQYWPTIDANAHYLRWQKHDFITLNTTPLIQSAILPSIIGPTNDYNFSVNSTYLLYDWGERRAQLMAARAQQSAACMEWAKIEQEILLNVSLAFYELVANVEREKVAIKNLERSDKNLAFVNERREVGSVPLADVYRAQVDVAEAKQQLVRARNMVRIAKVNLNASMGLPPEVEVSIAPAEPESLPPSSFNLQMAQINAMEHRPEVKEAEQQLRVLGYKIQEAQGAFGPKLVAEGGYGKRDSDWFPSDPEWVFGVSVDIPVFTGFNLTHNLRRTQAEFLKARAEFDQLMIKVQQDVWNAFSRLQESFESIETSVAQVEDAEESNRLTEERYRAGASTITDLLAAQTSLARAEAARVDAVWGYQAAKTIFLWTQGQPLQE